ncbi:hypothetical protein GCM10009678_45120 [Actinomadura kijaniata]|uniref:APA family basic amino acid/polyamine antiporter n=1 Tax=Actinomadura namibiensis TaxID=182080 RepID=A0A7W3QQI4_ACTNM|nr:amino acid permease [Actinomadura namibiensis]MBA8955739.1 APA family basic amino acid/polyamine antiporter [Actinomadura namibiensis]
MRNTMLRRLPVEQATGQLYGGRHRLRVVYRTRDLIVLGLGVMIGAGVFKVAGQQAASNAGPAVIVSLLVAGAVCLLAALAYAEMSSIVPVAGSAYSFSYVAFGEVWAWVVGWALILELLLAASVVARAWSLYAAQVLADFSVPVPDWLAGIIGQPKGFDLFALGILVLLIVMLATGGRMSLRTLWFMVLAKLIVVGLAVATGLKFFNADNLTPFVPPSRPAGTDDPTMLDALFGFLGDGSPQAFGIWGVFAATPAIVFAYIGFDLISTASEETDDAPRKVPRGMLLSMLVSIVLYVAVAVALVGMVRYDQLDPAKPPLTAAFDVVGAQSMNKVVDVGIVIALTTVILVVLISLTRVVFSMARDGLLPRGVAGMSRYRVPSRSTLVAGGAAVVMSQTVDVLTLEQLVVIGTLFAFGFVSAAMIAMRRSRPDLHRPFRVPAATLTGTLAIVATVWLMLNLKVETWVYFLVWMAVGLVLYFAYGHRRSHLRMLLDQPPGAPLPYEAPPPGSGAYEQAVRSSGGRRRAGNPFAEPYADPHLSPGPYGSPQPYGAPVEPAPRQATGGYRLDPEPPAPRESGPSLGGPYPSGVRSAPESPYPHDPYRVLPPRDPFQPREPHQERDPYQERPYRQQGPYQGQDPYRGQDRGRPDEARWNDEPPRPEGRHRR